MRLRGLSPASGLLAAVLFALGAKQTVHVIHWNFAATTAFWPWMLAGLEGFAASRRSRFLLLSAVATALCWLGGSPQMAHFGSMVAGLYALRIAADLWPERRADAVWAVVVVPIGFVLASVLVLPALELSRMGPRSMVVDYAFVTSWKWPDAWGLALLVLPHAYGDGRWGLNLWEATGYVGIPALALAVAAPLRRRGVVLFAVLAVLGAWLSLGDRAPLGASLVVLQVPPGLRQLPGSDPRPARHRLRHGDALRRGARRPAARPDAGPAGPKPRPLRGRRALALALPRLPGWPFDPVSTRKTAWFAVMISGLGALWVIAVWRGLRGALAGAAMVALAFYDPWYLFSRFNEVSRSADERPALSRLRPVRSSRPRAPPGRRGGKVGRLDQRPAAQRLGRDHGLRPHVHPARPRAARGHSARPGGAARRHGRRRHLSRGEPPVAALAAPRDAHRHLRPPQPGLVDFFVGKREWENPLVGFRAPALPRVFWTGSWEVAPDAAVTGPLLRAARGDLAVLPEPPAGLRRQARRRGRWPPRRSGWTDRRLRRRWSRPGTGWR